MKPMKARLLLAVAALHVDVAYGTAGIKLIPHQGHGCTGTQSWSTFTAVGPLDHDSVNNPIQADDNVCTSAGFLNGTDNGYTWSAEVYIKGSCCAPKEKFIYAFYSDAACTNNLDEDDEVTEHTKEVGQTYKCVNHGSGSTARSQNFTCANVPDSCKVTEDNETEILPGFVFTIIFVVLGVVVLGLVITCAVPKLRSKAFECCGCAEQDKAVV